MNRSKEIRVKVSDDEHALIDEAASKIGLEKATYLRMLGVKDATKDNDDGKAVQKSSGKTGKA